MLIRNDFHNQSLVIRGGMLSASRVRAIRRQLCGVTGCQCAESALATRGPQADRFLIIPESDGRVRVELAS